MTWKKGESGNLAGKPIQSRDRDKLISDRLRAWLRSDFKGKDDPKERSYADKIAENLVEQAAQGAGNLAAIAMILDRVEGRPLQDTHVTIDDKREKTDWTRAELAAFVRNALASSARAVEKNGRGGASDQVH